MQRDEGLDMPGVRDQAPYNQEADALPPVAEITTEPAVAALSRESIVRLIDKYEQIANSGASYSEFCHEFTADLKELI